MTKALTTVRHYRSDGIWALPLCIMPNEAYAYGRSQDPATIGQQVKIRITKTTTTDAEQVTCLKCIELLAKEVEEALEPSIKVHRKDAKVAHFGTMQEAWDSLPDVITSDVTINVPAGRPAPVDFSGKTVADGVDININGPVSPGGAPRLDHYIDPGKWAEAVRKHLKTSVKL